MLEYSWPKEVLGHFYSSFQYTNFSQNFKPFDGFLHKLGFATQPEELTSLTCLGQECGPGVKE